MSFREYAAAHPEFNFVAVHVNGDDEPAREFVAKYEWPFPVLADGKWKQASRWGVRAHPALVLLDEDGGVVAGTYGPGSPADWDEMAKGLER